MEACRAPLLKGSWEVKAGVEATVDVAVESGLDEAAEAAAGIVVGVVLVVFVYREFQPEYLDMTQNYGIDEVP